MILKEINYIPASYGGATLYYQGMKDAIYVNSSTYDGKGLRLNSSYFTAGKKYMLTFAFQKIAGTLTDVSGHQAGFTCEARYLDGNYKDANYNAASEQSLINDGLMHYITVILTYNANSSDNNLYIQPNRGTGIGSAYTVEIYNVHLYEILDEESTVQITKNGILLNSVILELSNRQQLNNIDEAIWNSFYEY